MSLFKALRLPCGGQDGAPPTAGRIKALGVSGKQLDGNMDEAVVEEADDETGLAGHRGVYGITREQVAEDVVLAVCGPAAGLVARIKIAHSNGNPFSLQYAAIRSRKKRPMSLSFTLPEASRSFSVGSEQVLAGALRNCDDGVRFGEDPLLDGREKCFELEGHLRDKRKVHVLACDRGARRDEASVATHEFDEPDPAGHAACFGMRAIEHARGLPDRAVESERARDESDVVVDGLGDADERARGPGARFLVEIVRTALRAVATDGEENVNATRDKVIHRDAGTYRAARGAEDGASFLMNAIDELRRDLHRLGTFCGVEPAVTAAKAKDLGDAVAIVQFEKQRADDVVEAGAEAATRYNARPRLFRVEEEFGTRAANSN